MSSLVRFGVSLERSLLKQFDHWLGQKAYDNRSEAFRDLIRQELVKTEWAGGKKVAEGTAREILSDSFLMDRNGLEVPASLMVAV